MTDESNNRAEAVEIQELTDIMSTIPGRNFINRLLDSTGYFDDTFVHDPINHARKAGRREIGVEMFDNLQRCCPDKLMLMLKERING